MGFYYELLHRDFQADGIQVAHYRPTKNTQGAWNENEQHMAPATGVICAELESFRPKDHMQIARISLDILGMIHLDDFSITTRCIRPGKTIELIESVFEVKGRTCIVARTWRMITEDTSDVAGLEDKPMPSHESLPAWKGMSLWDGGYIRSVSKNIKVVERRPGKGKVWITNDLEMVKGETTSSFVKLMGMVDTMNGVVIRQDIPFSYMFPNVDLQIHLYRLPQGKHLGLEVKQQYGKDGIGLTSAVLHDKEGPFGHAEQILTLRKMPRA
ncbi:MAG: thioesterase family protein [Aequorivita sp.]